MTKFPNYEIIEKNAGGIFDRINTVNRIGERASEVAIDLRATGRVSDSLKDRHPEPVEGSLTKPSERW